MGRKKFANFTLNNVGKTAAIIIDDKLVSAPRINAQITQGILLIVGNLDLKTAESFAAGIVLKNRD